MLLEGLPVVDGLVALAQIQYAMGVDEIYLPRRFEHDHREATKIASPKKSG
uniref:Cob(I)yrinic acid a,c-diamide adenosyltransferase n=1 Tax=Heterorhabditis bacteriophora TaxID=37862 RepID=A0A1I7W6L7_HETBA